MHELSRVGEAGTLMTLHSLLEEVREQAGSGEKTAAGAQEKKKTDGRRCRQAARGPSRKSERAKEKNGQQQRTEGTENTLCTAKSETDMQ